MDKQAPHKGQNQAQSVNPRTGRVERVFVNLELVYPNPDDPTAEEYCFEELRARARGWIGRDWKKERREAVEGPLRQTEDVDQHLTEKKPFQEQVLTTVPLKDQSQIEVVETIQTTHTVHTTTQQVKTKEDEAWLLAEKMQACKVDDKRELCVLADENDENAPPSQEELAKAALAKKLRREERANQTRKIKVMEVKGATQTSKFDFLFSCKSVKLCTLWVEPSAIDIY